LDYSSVVRTVQTFFATKRKTGLRDISYSHKANTSKHVNIFFKLQTFKTLSSILNKPEMCHMPPAFKGFNENCRYR